VRANFEIDVKKIIALSTLRQLGVIIMTLSLGLVELTFLHLLVHALFKSLLFLCAGVYIHNRVDIQDVRNLGGFADSLPLTSVYFLRCSLSLCGFPFISGFYSKDLILENYLIGEGINFYWLNLVIVGTLCTFMYSLRVCINLFKKNLENTMVIVIKESKIMYYSIGVLFFLSLLRGSLYVILFINPIIVILRIGFKLIILIVGGFLGLARYFLITSKRLKSAGPTKNKIMITYLGTMWFTPLLRVNPFVQILKYGGRMVKNLDQGWIEELGGQGGINKIFSLLPNFDS